MRMRTAFVFLLSVPLWAQDPLSLRQAVRLAIQEHKAIAGAAAGARASESRITQARAAMLPKINYSESFARSNNPVFVFSSLLTQHQFEVENFAIGPLNRPDSLNAFNRTNLNLPGRVFNGPGFGVISGSGPARQVQVGARITF